MKKIVSCIMLVVLVLSSSVHAEGAERSELIWKVGDSLLERFSITREAFATGEYEDSGEIVSCILWYDDIDMEDAIKYGIDQAEKTRTEPIQNYEYPYEVYYEDGVKDIIVEIPDKEDDEYVQTYIESKRGYASEQYEVINTERAVDLEKLDVNIEYISKYSPCVFTDLNLTKIESIIEMDDVLFIDLWNNEYQEDTTYYDFSNSDLTTMMTASRVSDAKDDYGLTGSGILIGQFEPAVPNTGTTVNPNAKNTHNEDGETTHPDNVYHIMKTIANNATFYSSGMFKNNSNVGIYVNGAKCVEWLLDQGVNIINMSCGGVKANQYDSNARWIDHIAYNHDVHVVKSAGNKATYDDGSTNNKISSPGMAYNIITVGRTKLTNYSVIEPSSSRNNDGVSRTGRRTYKPDIVTAASRGTSYSTPVITATIALMCEYEPSLKTKQHVVKAILAATTSKTYGRYDTGSSDFVSYGTGVVDARSAIYGISSGHYTATGTVSSSSTTKTYNMDVTSSDTTMRVALAYAHRIKFSGAHYSEDGTSASYNLAPYANGYIGELKLQIKNPSGTIIKECTVNGANLKTITFTVGNNGYGTYKIIVTQTISASNGRVTNFGVSWR